MLSLIKNLFKRKPPIIQFAIRDLQGSLIWTGMIVNKFNDVLNLSEALRVAISEGFTDFRDADLRFIQMKNEDLSTINFCGADLSNSEFEGTDFTCADLSFADLSNCYLLNAEFDDANLSRTNLNGSYGFKIYTH